MNTLLPNLTGDWIGSYPGHYDEVVHITQHGDWLQARKVTGDDHVPAGELTWRVNITTLAGEGQIAEKEFRSPRFVPGRLLIHNDERIEFVWKNFGTVEYRRDD
jgi:hypothetical protein